MRKLFMGVIGLGITLGLAARFLERKHVFSKEITLKELDKKIAASDSFVVLFTWKERCPDSVAFQNNYLKPKFKKDEQWTNAFYVVNLDKEMPSALLNHQERQVLMDKYGIATSPALIDYSNPEAPRILAWDAKQSDPFTAIDSDVCDKFFEEIRIDR